MNKDLKALRNYVTEQYNQTGMKESDYRYIITKVEAISAELNRLEQKAEVAERKEKLGIEKQKEFGESQTAVEQARHANIIEEIKALKDAGIVAFNRSSYPFYARHKPQRGKKDARTPRRT